MRREGYSTWSVFLCVCVSVFLSVCLSVCDYSHSRGNESASERYQQLQCNKHSNNNGAFAKTTANKSVKLALSLTTLHGPTHQLAVHACVYVPHTPSLAALHHGVQRCYSALSILLLPACEKLALSTGITRGPPVSWLIKIYYASNAATPRMAPRVCTFRKM